VGSGAFPLEGNAASRPESRTLSKTVSKPIKALTAKQKLVKALTACRKRHGKKRMTCEVRARKEYAKTKNVTAKHAGARRPRRIK